MEPSLWQRARKAFVAAGGAGLAAGWAAYKTVSDGGVSAEEWGAVAGAGLAAAVAMWVATFFTRNAKSTKDI